MKDKTKALIYACRIYCYNNRVGKRIKKEEIAYLYFKYLKAVLMRKKGKKYNSIKYYKTKEGKSIV